MASTNLFKQIYSTAYKVQPSGYKCAAAAIDESATSFDISGSSGNITDANGNTLASLDLSSIHAGDLSQYNVETRVLRPHSCYLLQGHEYGMSYGTYYFVVPKPVYEVEGYEQYINIDFDLVYSNFGSKKIHISAETDGTESVIDVLNTLFSDNNIKIAASIEEDTNKLHKEKDYIVFTAQEDGYFCFIINLKLTINAQSEEYPASPFSVEINDIRETIYDLIMAQHPVMIDETYDRTTYEANCALYKWLLYYHNDALRMIDLFDYFIYVFKSMSNHNNFGVMRPDDYSYYDGFLRDLYKDEHFDDDDDEIEETEKPKEDSENVDGEDDSDENGDNTYGLGNFYVPDFVYDVSSGDPDASTAIHINRWLSDDELRFLIDDDQIAAIIDNVNTLIQATPYDDDIFNRYDIDNMIRIRDILYALKLEYEGEQTKFPSHFWLIEKLEKRIPVMKYPNGAFRGICIIPDFPEGDEYEYQVLKVNHIKDHIGLWTDRFGHLEKHHFNVIPNAIIRTERNDIFRNTQVFSNESLSTNIDDGWFNDTDNAPIAHHDIELAYQNNGHDYIGQGCFGSKHNVIGLFRYMEYVEEEALWTNIGEAYIAIAKEDDSQSRIKNLLNSLVIYNPNDIPVRIKYIAFS